MYVEETVSQEYLQDLKVTEGTCCHGGSVLSAVLGVDVSSVVQEKTSSSSKITTCSIIAQSYSYICVPPLSQSDKQKDLIPDSLHLYAFFI